MTDHLVEGGLWRWISVWGTDCISRGAEERIQQEVAERHTQVDGDRRGTRPLAVVDESVTLSGGLNTSTCQSVLTERSIPSTSRLLPGVESLWDRNWRDWSLHCPKQVGYSMTRTSPTIRTACSHPAKYFTGVFLFFLPTSKVNCFA